MAISCCRYCVPPKRNPWCHSDCPDYLKEKAAHDERKATDDKNRAVKQGIYSQYQTKVYRAMKNRRKGL